MRRRPQPRFKAGDKVKVSVKGGAVCEIEGEPRWNGLTWMYSFVGHAMSCGEDYLSRAEVSNA